MAFGYIRQFLASEAFKNTGREIRDVAPRLVKFVCFVQVTKTHLLTVALCYGPSMLPTIGLAGNNLCLAERISTRFDRIGVGDIVMVRSPEAPRKTVAKRLIATEGQSVTYVVDPKNGDRSETIVVPKGHVWVEGDNIYASRDSRNFGPVPYGLVEGRIFWRIWPPKDFGWLEQSKRKDMDS
ncbi:uncharacterized protein LOC126623888 isoform X1 [Malus sylvestris]|uniref:uncharacterized protein LOC126623888 isoform X1 n=1 Tax=Malus sylvestris TaxID=3752 RepID=UPI0021ACD93E|nr:uncharacterized protein LOC126623888 isoform X1 [Malus sylvestris]